MHLVILELGADLVRCHVQRAVAFGSFDDASRRCSTLAQDERGLSAKRIRRRKSVGVRRRILMLIRVRAGRAQASLFLFCS
jgi:hypothetical protein